MVGRGVINASAAAAAHRLSFDIAQEQFPPLPSNAQRRGGGGGGGGIQKGVGWTSGVSSSARRARAAAATTCRKDYFWMWEGERGGGGGFLHSFSQSPLLSSLSLSLLGRIPRLSKRLSRLARERRKEGRWGRREFPFSASEKVSPPHLLLCWISFSPTEKRHLFIFSLFFPCHSRYILLPPPPPSSIQQSKRGAGLEATTRKKRAIATKKSFSTSHDRRPAAWMEKKRNDGEERRRKGMGIGCIRGARHSSTRYIGYKGTFGIKKRRICGSAFLRLLRFRTACACVCNPRSRILLSLEAPISRIGGRLFGGDSGFSCIR